MDEHDRDPATDKVAHRADERHELGDVLERSRLIHSKPVERAGDQDVGLVLAYGGGKRFPAALVGECRLRPGLVDDMDATLEWRSGPGVALASQLPPKGWPRSFVLDDQDAERPGDRDAEPVVAGGEVAGEVDA